jgi:spore maturation protein CgeB
VVRGDVVWVGNWGDGERAAELQAFLLDPVAELGLAAEAWGVRFPEAGRVAFAEAGFRYRGWLANHHVPPTFGAHRVTVHVPRRPYTQALPGVPTIRVFEALACGIPLVCAPWDDAEGLFVPGADYLVAGDGTAMRRALRAVLADDDLRRGLIRHGLATVRARHTCAHRVDELLGHLERLRGACLTEVA